MKRYLLGIYEQDGERLVKNFSITEPLEKLKYEIMQHCFFIYNLTTNEIVKNYSKDSIDVDDFRCIVEVLK